MGTFFPPTWDAARDAFASVLEEIAADEFDADALLRDFESADASKADKRLDAVREALREKGLRTQSFLLNGEYARESHALRIAPRSNNCSRTSCDKRWTPCVVSSASGR